jgi:hypothetical protein
MNQVQPANDTLHPQEELLTPFEVHQITKTSLPWVYRSSATGLLPSIRIPCNAGKGKRKKELVRFRKSDLWAFLDSCQQGERLSPITRRNSNASFR